jgi:electron transfer flavoprotein alpha subunit
MATVLVVAEHKDGKLKKVTHELVSRAAADGADTVALLIGLGVDSLVADLGKMGAKKILTVQGDAVKYYNNEAYGRAVKAAADTIKPQIILLPATAMGKDLAPRVSGLLGTGMASDCVHIKIQGDKLLAKRPIYAGKAIAEVEFLGTGPQVATVRPNALTIEASVPAGATSAEQLTVDFNGIKSVVKDVAKGSSTKVDLTEANVIVSGGRSLKSSENFAILEKLSEVIPGSAVGASRAAVDAGYRPHSYQVGQTGKVVSPSLYLAFGISGAIQHLAGMRTSKVIVAVNKDPEAPIFQIADYGIVADLFDVVPALTEELKKFYSSQH